jgi:hypothetical protein
MKLITLGCSLTENGGVASTLSKLAGIKLLNVAHSAGSNQLQVLRMQELIVNDQIAADDIIYWQITGIYRTHLRLQLARLAEVEEIQKSEFSANGLHHYTPSEKNIFDKFNRIDLLANSPLVESSSTADIDDSLQTLVACLISTKRAVANLTVVFGWDAIMDPYRSKIFKQYLAKFNINFVDQSFLEYAVHNRLGMTDSMHPDTAAGVQFATEIAYPSIVNQLKSNSEN